jgi:hypothetical protein
MLEFDLNWDNLDQAFEALTVECEKVVRGITVEAWNAVLKQTPQFYGRAVASWTYTIGSPVFIDRSGEMEDTAEFGNMPMSKGNPTPIGVANSMNYGASDRFRLGDTVWFANGVDHGEGPYAGGLESGSIKLRAGNRPGQMVSRALDLMQSRYGQDVSVSAAHRLKGLRLGF